MRMFMSGESGKVFAYIDEFHQLRKLEKKVRRLMNEVNCRIEHGAESGGHLEYVGKRLKDMLNNDTS